MGMSLCVHDGDDDDLDEPAYCRSHVTDHLWSIPAMTAEHLGLGDLQEVNNTARCNEPQQNQPYN